MKKRLSLIGTFLILLLACKKEEIPEQKPTTNSPTNPIQYIDDHYERFYFPNNAYWVYENTLTNEIDSIVKNGSNSGFYWNPPPISADPTSAIKREYYKSNMKSITHDYEYVDFINSNGIRINPETEWYVCGRLYYNKDWDKIDSLIVGEHVFYDVIKRQIIADNHSPSCSNSGFNVNTDFYTAPDFGIIRKVIFDSNETSTWDLIRWNVEL